MRILHVSDFAAPYPGAFIRQLRMLADEVDRRALGTMAFAFPEAAQDKQWYLDLASSGLSVSAIPASTVLGSRTAIHAIRAIVADFDPDIVHTHFGTYDVAVARSIRHVSRTKRMRRPRLLWHYRTALEEKLSDRSRARVLKDWLRYRVLGQGVTHSVSVTKALAGEVEARGMGRRSIAVVAGCDTETFAADPAQREVTRSELGLGQDEIMLLHLGWAWHRKGGDLLAKATMKLQAEGHPVTAFSVGAPANEVESPVVGIQSTNDIARYHQAADIFISASRSEGFGNGLVEAMACERVAVAAAAAGQIETFSGLDGVETVVPGDADDLARGIRQMIAQREAWAQLGKANRVRVIERHSMRRWASEMADVYVDVAGTAGADS